MPPIFTALVLPSVSSRYGLTPTGVVAVTFIVLLGVIYAFAKANSRRAGENAALVKRNEVLSATASCAERMSGEIEAGRKENLRKAAELAAGLKENERKSRELESARGENERKVRTLDCELQTAQRMTVTLQAALKEAEQKIGELEKQIAICTSQAKLPIEKASGNGQIYVDLSFDGRETFSPILENGRIYEVRVEGTCALIRRSSLGEARGYADGFYRTDDRGNFTNPHEWLYIDGVSLHSLFRKGTAHLWRQDREGHVYAFRVKGIGEKAGISFRTCVLEEAVAGAPSTLRLAVEMLPQGARLLSKKCPQVMGIDKDAQKEKTLGEKAREERDHERRLEIVKTEDKLNQMGIAFERQRKIVERFEAEKESIQKKADMSEENKKVLIAAFRAVLRETLEPRGDKSDESVGPIKPKEPYVL